MAHAVGRAFGIIGLGTIAEFHARAIQAMAGGHLACAFSRSGGEKAAKFAADFGCKLYTEDFNAFLKHPGLDIVTVTTPSGAHLEPVVAAAKAKKHILCEKPLEITLERCDKMLAACKKNKVKLGGVFQTRSKGAIKLVKDAIDSRRFGKLTVINAIIPWHRTQQYYDSGGWRGTWELDGGGALMNQSIHTVDILQHFGGPLKELTAYAGCLAHKRIEVEDTAAAALKFKNGAIGVLLASTAMFPGDLSEVHVSGEHGSARLRDGFLTFWKFDKEEPGDAQKLIDFGPQDSGNKGGAGDPRAISFVNHQRQFENFVRSLDKSEPLLVDGSEARKTVEIILGVYQSALTGKAVRFPLKKTPKRGKFAK